jgi:hypothetical protein
MAQAGLSRRRLRNLGTSVVDAERHHLLKGFINADRGGCLGMGTHTTWCASSPPCRSAPHASPLIGLPGNVPINEPIDRLSASGTRFASSCRAVQHFQPQSLSRGVS